MTTPAALRDEGMNRAEIHADARRIAIIDAEIARLNALGCPWSCNDARAALPTCSPGLVGARVRAAANRKPREMRRVGWTASDLPSTHGAVLRVWQGVGS